MVVISYIEHLYPTISLVKLLFDNITLYITSSNNGFTNDSFVYNYIKLFFIAILPVSIYFNIVNSL